MQNVARARQLAATRAARRLSTVSKFHKMSAGGKPDGPNFNFLAPLNAKKMKGIDIMNDPLWNKGAGFTTVERQRLGLQGLLPPVVKTLCEQRDDFMKLLREREDPLDKNHTLQDLLDRNETLFHRVLIDHIEEVAPLVYTPTVGRACQTYSRYQKRARGLFITPEDRGNIAVILQNWTAPQCQVAVVTDGSRILGLGDLGVNGMGIPIGKLALYCGCGGVAPHRVLPIMLDFGTDNEQLLNDPMYRGVRHPRLRGDEYFSLVDEFMQALFRRYPAALLQFEDFSSDKASALLSKYRNQYLCFNDDIQGTGATVLAGVLGALRMKKREPEALRTLKVAVVGAGSAGIGVAQALLSAMEQAGCTHEQAAANFYVFDADGLLTSKRAGLSEEHAVFARSDLPEGLSLEACCEQVAPELILGLSGRKGTISEAAIRSMAAAHHQPIVMPLSNPTSATEITPEEAYTWTDGRAIVATGSPFDPVTIGGKTLYPSQCNNMYIFPGVGLGASVCLTETIPDSMLYHAAVALSKMTTDDELAKGSVFPAVDQIRTVSLNVAIACARDAYDKGLARANPARGETVEGFLERKMYFPEYVPIFSETE